MSGKRGTNATHRHTHTTHDDVAHTFSCTYTLCRKRNICVPSAELRLSWGTKYAHTPSAYATRASRVEHGKDERAILALCWVDISHIFHTTRFTCSTIHRRANMIMLMDMRANANTSHTRRDGLLKIIFQNTSLMVYAQFQNP